MIPNYRTPLPENPRIAAARVTGIALELDPQLVLKILWLYGRFLREAREKQERRARAAQYRARRAEAAAAARR